MKKINILFFALLISAFALTAAAQKRVDVFGYYTIVKAPRAFADISEIHLAGNYGEQQRPRVYGLIRMTKKSTRDYRLLKPKMTGRNITFKTQTVGGVYYEFSGTFTKLGNFPETRPEGKILLKGRLMRYKGGQKTAEADLNFSYSAGD